MSSDSYYEVLGLEPHATADDVKNAYRDLAKVWHPDRFTHDPRLQQKAQEKLKEINEAYKEITSGGHVGRRPRRPAAAPPPPARAHAPHARRHARGPGGPPHVVVVREERRRSALPLVLAAIVAGVALFAGYRLLRGTNAPAPAPRPEASADGAAAEDERQEETAAGAERRDRKANTRQRADEGGAAGAARQTDAPPDNAVSATLRRLPTVNRTIDPTTGLLATRACPLKSLRTYPAGQEPQQFCNADHTARGASSPPPRQETVEVPAPLSPAPRQADEGGGGSRVKSVLGTAVSPHRWFKRKKGKAPGEGSEPPGGR